MTTTDDAAEATFIAQCQKDYQAADLVALAHESPAASDLRLLLFVVELLPPWLEADPNVGHAPDDHGYPRSIELGDALGKFRIQRWTLPVGDAIARYRGCLAGSLAVPGYRKNRPAPDSIVSLPPLNEDPIWPHLAVERDHFWESGIPFWGNRPGGSRWHRLLAADPVDIVSGWNKADINRARALVRDEIHIDLLSRSVLFGSCHLLLPNPLYSDASLRVQDDWRSVELDIRPRPGRTTEGLELVIWARRAWGETSIIRQPVTVPRTVVALPEGVEQTAHAVVCSARGLLERTDEATFVASIGMGMHLISEERRVNVPARSKTRPAQEYVVGIAGPAHDTMAGAPRPPGAAQRLMRDELNLKARATWKGLEIRWFDKNIHAGQTVIRDIIGKARRSIELIDPYFGMEDLMSFPLASTLRGLPMRILTSADVCTDLHRTGRLENGEVLLKALQHIKAQDPNMNIEIKVLPGAKSPVHDRFLIVDGWVWVLGASLNEFGERGTLLLRLPAEPIKEIGDPEWLSISHDVFDVHWSRPADEVAPLIQFVARRARERQQLPFDKRLTQTIARVRSAYRHIRRLWRA